MININFEWDTTKEKTNKNKHGVSFSEASTVFEDETAIIFDDPEHSSNEDRSIILGFSNKANLLIVCHCLRENGRIIRIISARKATKKESEMFTEINNGW